MKHIFFTILAAALVLTGLSTQSSAAEPQWVIGFPEDNLANDWRAAQMNEIRRELARHPNVKFIMADAGGSVSQNIKDIEDMVAQGAQVLFLGPRNPAAVEPIIARIRQQGVKIILLTRKINSEDYDTYISPDDFKIGYEAALLLAEKLEGHGVVLMLEGVPTTSTSKRRKDGFFAGLANYPSVKVVTKVANYSRAEAIRVLEGTLDVGLKFDAIYAHNDAMATGARVALKKRGFTPGSIPIVSIDFLPETRDAIANGEQMASFTYPTCGKAGVAAALDILNGKKVPRYIPVPFVLVTSDNVKDVKTVY